MANCRLCVVVILQFLALNSSAIVAIPVPVILIGNCFIFLFHLQQIHCLTQICTTRIIRKLQSYFMWNLLFLRIVMYKYIVYCQQKLFRFTHIFSDHDNFGLWSRYWPNKYYWEDLVSGIFYKPPAVLQGDSMEFYQVFLLWFLWSRELKSQNS